ncbi:NADPH dehydrogenase quinone protein [Furfurilactobacillus rossiae]|uniref:NAD(P)H-dependent oxidoreductase n=1 Tax=Furfurilactobacillus rossiae TaxID=231049 RepID=UPI0015BB1382|nr:NAD(P)H-dependent oxidoreductase [Furfurilactobacillus rossiae]QLE62915.1 NADPH dehydrogenase quinone protein [Furfurilactobacillus rossiae]
MSDKAQVTIIYVHPWGGSFSHAELEQVTQTLAARQQDYKLIDLYADGFDPVMRATDLSVYGKGDFKDPMVAKYIDIIQKTNKVIVMFPIWWLSMPAMLKGFFDKVFLANHIINFVGKKAVPHTAVNSAMVLSTSELTNDELFKGYEGSVERIVNFPLESIGAKQVTWHNMGDIIVAKRPALTDYLKQIPGFVNAFLDEDDTK